MSRTPGRFVIAGLALGLLGACGDAEYHASNTRHWVPLTPELLASMQEKGMDKSDPVLIRTYKQEAEFEVWKKAKDGRYALLKTFPMCRWSGQLGPKRKEGDRQAPEGYYAITPAQLNPNSHYHLSYDIGYPNAYDRAHGGTGSYLMVHGDCSSAGCYSMTDQQIEEIYALVREAQSGGQKAVQMEAFPFRFTAQNMARHRLDPNMPFWKNLKEGADRFEITKVEPKVGVCQGRYTFDHVTGSGDATACGADTDPELTLQVADKERDDNARVAELASKGMPAVRFAYEDGGQHPSFKYKVAETSRPDSIAMGPVIELQDSKGAVTKAAVRARRRWLR
jgi:murein L,D-transpeptidase YafK